MYQRILVPLGVLLGSGAEQIIRLSPVPVLVIRSSGDESHPSTTE